MPGILLSKDPWKRDNNNPPDLDELFSKFTNEVLGGAGGSTNQTGTSGGSWFIPLMFTLLMALWFVSGFFIVRPAQEGVVLRFGRFHSTIGPGLHWMLRGVDSVKLVNTSRVEPIMYTSRMLTEDENYVKASLVVYYRVKDPVAFLYSVQDPVMALTETVASSLRQVVGHTMLEGLLTTQKEAVRLEAEKLIRTINDSYKSGLEITDVKLQEITVPNVVIEYFDDVIKAREEKAKKISEGERYVKEIIPRARGQAERMVRAAKAYQEKVVLDAQAEVAKFLAVLPEYEKNPSITRDRLYYETMQEVLSRLKKVYVDDSKQMLYLPVTGSSQASESTRSLPLLHELSSEHNHVKTQ